MEGKLNPFVLPSESFVLVSKIVFMSIELLEKGTYLLDWMSHRATVIGALGKNKTVFQISLF